ncbi:glutathione S-transferase [Roseiterribacter gracilis]|uniref:Glutathione S-transferase n=1 Tax=Roseiterribacter gracilis TaxID=2812848 RepID=A0A8S8XCV5_9PROT|nr:glutathione S-transferase [Rhodospirillales bacterium TMPK1]
MTERILYSTSLSGHGHRVELLLDLLGLTYKFVDAPADVRKTPEFAALNPLQQIPVLQDGDVILTDSNAILVYLAKTYDRSGKWLPDTPLEAARVQRFLSIAAGEVMYGPGIARRVLQFGMSGDPVSATQIAERLLRFLEQHLADKDYLATTHPTIADLACYSYVAHAPEGGIPLDPYPSVQAWIARIESIPGFRGMPRLPIPQVA